MILAKDFVNKLNSYGFSRYLMVPCSIFKPLNNWMLKNGMDLLFPPNEAHAVGFAVGSYLATKKPAVVFMQNSGLNNVANIQTSLNSIYNIPVILFISWRGEPGKKDAPEHIEMGKVTEQYLNDLKILYVVLSENWQEELDKIVNISNNESCPVAILVKDGLFEKEDGICDLLDEKYSLSRIEAIKIIKDNLKDNASYISTNGFISRDSFAVSETPDFYMMGSMGHAFSLGAGVAAELKKNGSSRKTVAIDGDGGCLMHLGSLAMIGLDKLKESNLIYFILDNECYDSTGAQPTLSSEVDFVKLAEAFGFPQRYSIKTGNDLISALNDLKPNLATLIHVKMNRKSGGVTKRVSDVYTCEEIAKRFMNNF
jgi:phosphonopyruvate decarboxylase